MPPRKKQNFLYYMLIIIIILFVFYFLFENRVKSYKKISREEFNTLFQTDIDELPQNICAYGVKDSKVYCLLDTRIESNKIRFEALHSFYSRSIAPQIPFEKYYFLYCLFDGYLERIPYSPGTLTIKRFEPKTFQGKREPIVSSSIIPIFDSQNVLFASAIKINDTNTIAIPDIHYMLYDGYKSYMLDSIDANLVPWDKKESKCVWRGKIENGTPHNFFHYTPSLTKNQREIFVENTMRGMYPLVNYSKSSLSKEQQIKYKYILDIDGYTNTFDSTVWKLYSGSVLLKPKSVWKQWYHEDLKEYVHYVPVENDLSNLNQQIQWCIDHDAECHRIAEQAREFVKTRLSKDFVVKEFTSIVLTNLHPS